MTTVWYFKYLPTESNTTCYAFGCVAGAGVDVGDHIEWIAAIFNIVLTIVFGFCIRSFNRNGASSHNDYMKKRKKAVL
uniref:Holin n=1 Tax=Acrobeloides nanus TaxID=290746 RepID=A0A914EKX7_9BILA